MKSVFVVIPNWNGRSELADCLDALLSQSLSASIIVVDNGSSDGSVELIEQKYPLVDLIKFSYNTGFAKAVNAGFQRALNQNAKYIALINNDAVASADWLENLHNTIEKNDEIGIITSKILDKSAKKIDSTGEQYTTWGLPYPRGRGEKDVGQHDTQTKIFAASGGASLYSAKLLKEAGLFDEDFFAYYEDVDISFRAQLAGWKVAYEPKAVVYHSIGATSGKIPGFTTYQTLKNLPFLFWKNVPAGLFIKIFPKFMLAYLSIYVSAIARGQFWPATKGLLISLALWPKKLIQRWRIQTRKKVSSAYIDSLLVHDLPPQAHRLRVFRKVLSLGIVK